MAYCLRPRCPKSSKTSHSFGFILSSRFLFIQGKRCRQYAILSKRLTQYGRKAWTQNRAYAAFHLVKRRPPRPKPNENPSPYVVRLSLCYGIGRTHPFAGARGAPPINRLAISTNKTKAALRYCCDDSCLRVGSPFFSHKVNVEASKSLCENSTYSASFVRQASLIRKTCTASFMGALTEKRGFRWRIFYYCQTLARSIALPCSNSIFKA